MNVLRHPLAAIFLPVILMCAPALAADAPDATLDRPPHIRVPHIVGPLSIDGDLSKPEWAQAAVIPELIQNSPHPGEPTEYRTEVRLLRDDSHLYIAVHALDPHPEQIRVLTQQRDKDQNFDDHISVVLDTFRDHRTGYAFRINVAGARQDGIDPNGGATNLDMSWDGIWDAATRRTPEGWDMEIAIDTRSLQLRNDADQWGFNILRDFPRNNLTLVWTGRAQSGSIWDLEHEGIIEGMAGMREGDRLELSPYVLARHDQLHSGSRSEDIGGEAKYNLTPDLSGTLTVNTDFAQTEADAQQINLTRFSLFFPEKRKFFLDGQSLFAFNGGPLNGDLNGGFIPFYSRTVGLVNGQTVPIDEGVKVIGRAGDLSMGVLDTRMGSIPGVPNTNLAIARFTYNLDEQLQVGTLVTQGNPDGLSHENFVGFDTGWHTSTFLTDQNLWTTAWAADTGGSRQTGQTKGWGFDVSYPNVFWNWEAQLNVFGDAFDPTLGFLPRPGTRQYYETLNYNPRPAPGSQSGIDNYVYGQSFNQISGLDGHTQSSKATVTPFSAFWSNGNFMSLRLNDEYESLNAPFQVDPNIAIPPGKYSFDSYRLEWDTSPLQPVWVNLVIVGGQFYSGHAQNNTVTVNWAGWDGRLEFSLSNESVFARLPQGHFVQRLWQLNAAYSFSPNLSLTTFVQYDTSVDQLGFNTRLHWVIAADKDLYVVWNRNWRQALVNATPGVPDVADTFIVKLAWSFN